MQQKSFQALLLGKLEKERENGILDFKYYEESGYAEVWIEWMEKRYKEHLEMCMDTIITGWKLIGQQYPENVLIKNI